MEKKRKVSFSRLTPQDQLKYEIAQEIGLLDKVIEGGWDSLSAKESGKIGGMVAKRKKQLSQEMQKGEDE